MVIVPYIGDIMRKRDLNIEILPIDSLKSYEKNTKKHPKSQIEILKKSIEINEKYL